MGSEPIVKLERVSYMYPRSAGLVLRDISLEIHKGEILGLIGPTAAGKTTLCLAMNGIVPQFYGGRFFGRVTTAGFDTLDHPISTLARHVGVVFDDPETQLISTSVENEIAFPLENLNLAWRKSWLAYRACWLPCAWRALVSNTLQNCPVARNNGSLLPRPWPLSPLCWCSTSRRRSSTR